MFKFKSVVTLLSIVVLVAGACGDDDDNESGSGDDVTEAVAASYTVMVDGEADEFKMATTAYFPQRLSVAPGSTVEFESMFTGEPHTVTLGTLVDEGAAALEATPEGEEPESWQKLPLLLPEGPGDANQMAANPCILPTGEPPTDAACPANDDPPAFDGTQSVYNSGFLPDGERFEVELADDIEPGTYTFFCLLHRAGMMGEINVVEDAADADTPEEVATAAEDELDALIAKMKPVSDAVAKGDLSPFAPAAAGQVVAGGASEEAPAALLTGFGPEEVSIDTGGSVTWVVLGPHTISFNAPESVASSPIVKGPDGAFHANEPALAPQGGPGQPPPNEDGAGGEAGPPPKPRVVDGGRFDGTGFRSSGIFVSFPPQLDAYKLTFTKAGTFPYECLIHPEMEGTVKVG